MQTAVANVWAAILFGVADMKTTSRIALSSVLCAMSLLCLLLTFFPFATYALPAIAGVFLMPLVVECGKKTAFCAYLSVSVLALLLVPDMESKALFVAFFGYYPLLKAVAESTQSRFLEWVIKLCVFNLSVIIAYAILSLIGFPMDAFAINGLSLPLSTILCLFLIAGNGIFILYDIGLTRFLPLYFSRLQPLCRRLFFK